MESEADIATLLNGSAFHRAALDAVDALGLPDGWIAAGFIRNLVWDRLHGFTAPTPLSDIDVIYFDPDDISTAAEESRERVLAAALPGAGWQVRNQARMHRRNDDPAYRSSRDALRYFPETATAIAARAAGAGIEIAAPLGITDLAGLIVRPTPNFATKMGRYWERQAAKNWLARWPQLTILGEDGPIGAPPGPTQGGA